MPKVTFPLFGVGDRADRFREENHRPWRDGTLGRGALQTTTGKGGLLGLVDEWEALILVNGKPIHQLEDGQTF